METIFCEFLDRQNSDGTLTITPLGKARNSVDKPMLPGWREVESDVVIDERYADGLDGLEAYSHVIVLYWMDQEKECHLKHHPQGRADIPFVGIFSCRCPQRPNRLAMSTVELRSRNGNILRVKGLDIVNGTPILDIKPYTPQYDRVEQARVPDWIGKLIF